MRDQRFDFYRFLQCINSRAELEALAEELKHYLDVSANMKIYEEHVSFVSDQYQRLFDKGVIVRLDEEIRKNLRDAFAEIRLLNQQISVAWHSGQGSNVGAMNLNARGRVLLKAGIGSLQHTIL